MLLFCLYLEKNFLPSLFNCKRADPLGSAKLSAWFTFA